MAHSVASRSLIEAARLTRRQATNWLEPLERRNLAHGGVHEDELPLGLTPAQINALPIDSPLPFDLHLDAEGTVHGAAAFAADASPPPAASTTIRNSGATANRIDIAIVGDGYTSAQLGTYTAHAQNFLNNFFNEAPYDRYASYFNVHRVDVVSAESGVDNDPSLGVTRNTALNMNFFCSNIERLLCVDVNAARSYAANAPAYDEIVAIANSTKYGGAGYPSAEVTVYSGGNFDSIDVAKHEFAHALGDLADEYDYADGTTHAQVEPSAKNISIYNATQLAAMQAKWYRWLDLPNVDAFQGADYAQYGIYRPTSNSKMRSLGRPFEQVNVEQLILKIYGTVKPIDAATPAGTYETQTSTFSVDPVDPATGAPLSVQWYVDGAAIAGATGLNFSPSAFGIVGNHTLKVVVQDTTTAVRDEAARQALMTGSRSWTLKDTIAPTVTSAAFNYDVLPSPSVTFTFSEPVAASILNGDLVLINQTTGETIPSTSIAVTTTTGATNTATFTFPGFANGVLPDGNYTASFAANSVSDAAGNALANAQPLSFFVTAGDADHDRDVDFGDLLTLAKHYNQTGQTFSAGNFDYSADGLVSFSDLLILAKRYNSTLTAPPAPFAAAATVTPVVTRGSTTRRTSSNAAVLDGI